jgi:riboflavin kinase/FMN adenylyltransferase
MMSLGLGVFDGVHLGHQALLSHCSHALTFYPHPAHVLKKNSALQLLTTHEEMKSLIPNLLVLEFTEAISQMSPDIFLETVILKQFSPQQLVIGYDYCFGRHRMGNASYLLEWGKAHGIKVLVIPPVTLGGEPVKSSRIRTELLNGNFNHAIELLGHSYPLSGTVIHGQHRGAPLGFPTANLDIEAFKLIPCNGVYGGHVTIDGTRYKAGIYIGNRPTFKDELPKHQVEVHIIGFSGNLYDQPFCVEVTSQIRPELNFESLDQLKQQIEEDLTKIV